jgi:tetratricopeptide (TPR) repeat protein
MDENQNILKNINSYFSKEIDLDQSVRLMKSFKSFYYDSELCNFLNELAGDYDKQNKYKEAIIIYRFLIEIGEFNPNCSVRDLLPLYDEIAQCYIRQKDFESAKYELEFCETLIDKPNSEFLEIRMLIDLSCCYYQLKQYEKMDTILNELLNIIDSEDYLKDDKFYNLDEIYYWLGYCHLEMKQFKSSAAYFMKCVESHEKCSEIDFNRIYKINKLIGDCHKYALQEENAIIWYFKLLEEMKKFQKNNKTLNYCELFLELGICYLQLCQPLTSMYWLRKVFDLYQNMKTLDLKKTYGKAKFYFSWCLNRVHNHEKAKQYSKDAIDVFQELEPCERPSELGDSYLMLGISHQFLLNRGESLRNYSKCLEIYQNTNDETNQRQYNTAICYLYMGICVFRLRNYHDSHEFLKKAKEFFIKSSSDDIRKIGFINWELAEASLKLNRIKEAITHYEEALNSFTKSDYHSMIINSNSMLGLCYKMLEKKTKAFKYHKTALSEMQKMIGFPNDELNEKNLTLFLDKFEEYKSNNILSNELQHLLNTTSVKLTDYFVCNKNYRTAVFYLSQLKTKIEEHCLLQQILTGLGYCLNRLRDYAKTIEIMNEGIVMCESQEYNDPIDIATFSLWQAKAYKQIKEYDLAEKTLLKCIEIYKSQSYQESALALVNYYYGSLKLETSSDPQEAISYFTKASEYYSSLKKPINQLLPLIDKYSSYSSFKEISGICLLINNLEVDCSNLNFIFSQLNFKVETFSKVDCAKLCEIREEKFDSINECSYRSLVMIIISEGDNEAVTLMGDLTVIDDITGLFSNETCPNLKDKPKVFIFLTKQEVEKIYSKDKKFSNHEESSEYLLVLDDLETKIDNNLKADGLTRVYLPPISDLFIWNVLFNNDKSFDIIFEVFKKYFRNTELMEIAKLSVRANGNKSDFYDNQ